MLRSSTTVEVADAVGGRKPAQRTIHDTHCYIHCDISSHR